MDDEPVWAADYVVTPTLGSAITIPETTNDFAIKGNQLTRIKGNQFDGRTKTDPHKHIHEFLRICDMFKYKDTKNEAVRLMMFLLSLIGETKTWLDELNEGATKTRDELRTSFISRFFPPALFDRLLGEIRAFSQHENESLTDAWLHMKKMLRNCLGHNLSKGNIIKIFYHGLNEITQEVLNAAAGGIFFYKTPNQAFQLLEDKVLLKLHWAKNQKTKSSLKKTVAFATEADLGASINLMSYSRYAKLSLETLKPTKMSVRLAERSFQYPVGIAENILVKKQLNLGVRAERIIFHINSAMKHSYSNNDTCFSIDVIDEILEEDINALLDEGSEILHSIKGTILEEKHFAKFDEFMAMTVDENSESESDTEEPPFEKITFNIDYKIKTSFKEPLTDLELKPLSDNLEYIPVDLMDQEKTTFTCPFGTYAYRSMPFGICNALATFQMCMLAIFHDMTEESVKVFMDDLSIFESSFDHCLNNLDKMLQHCKDAHLVLNWEKCYFMVKEGIVLGHKVSEARPKVDKVKIEVISKLPPPTNINCIGSFLGHADSAKDSLKIS
uniref:Reverse transcriptase domain-containing protein n=1 Tax=Tanacetum cinerariifolium TaxID=118510 RepID=A0A699GYF8_TANCI|nr:reverse transcriptase domain-containing protein [Tanacetum cinerariifolium]